MAFSRVSGTLMKSLGLMGWVSGSSLGNDGSSLDFLDSRWVMAPRLVFGTACGVGNSPLRQCFWSCIALVALGMLLWQFIFSPLMAPFSGALFLLERRMIGSWNSSTHFSISYIPLSWNRMVLTSFIGNSPRKCCLM